MRPGASLRWRRLLNSSLVGRSSVRLRIAGFPVGCAAFCVLVGSLGNQGYAQGDPGQPAPRFNVDTTLVLIPANVTDPTNRFVLGLLKQDFHLFEDGVQQTIAHFSGEDTPLSVGLVFDASGSMDDKLETSRQAALQFLKTMNPQDEAFLVQFSD